MFGSYASSGYGIYLKEHYENDGTGEVLLPIDNCHDTRFILNIFDELFEDYTDRLGEVDVIHWNNGLWDCLHFMKSEKPTVPLERYKQNLAKIHAVLKEKCPRARIVFATTTPIAELQINKGYRTNAEICEYNAAATELLSGLGCYINDLYAFATDKLLAHHATDGVHFTEDGSVLLASRIAEVIDGILENG